MTLTLNSTKLHNDCKTCFNGQIFKYIYKFGQLHEQPNILKSLKCDLKFKISYRIFLKERNLISSTKRKKTLSHQNQRLLSEEKITAVSRSFWLAPERPFSCDPRAPSFVCIVKMFTPPSHRSHWLPWVNKQYSHALCFLNMFVPRV